MSPRKNKSEKRLVLAGGHAASTAYAVVKGIKESGLNWRLFFIGGRRPLEGKRGRTLAEVDFKDSDISYYKIVTGRIQRRMSIWTIPSIIKIPVGIIQSIYLIFRIRPDAVLSFGGYVAFPVVVAASLFDVPVIVHEQTTAAGRANILSARFAKLVALSRVSSSKYFPKSKVVVTGNPLNKKIFGIKIKKQLPATPTILVTGGASGSKVINENLEKLLTELLRKYKIIHQTGDYQYREFINLRNGLRKDLREKYQVFSVIRSQVWPDYLGKADIVISRAGANMVSEIIASRRPAVLIPLPIAYLDEQAKNAEFAEDNGIAVVIDQQSLNSDTLGMCISYVHDNWERMVETASKTRSPDIEATTKLIGLIAKIID
jgi:UDP-N-acetylglucosamine--N-acetylmuramyl-(pentapeptide) pyrophosphoryl-undecaprenol N-acetylglucosamine transferase